MRPQPVIQGVNIVLRGNFSPAIFHPAWLAAQGLIRSQEADEAEVEIVHSEVTQFRVDWLQMTVTTDRFQAGTTQEPYYEPLRDLVIGIFGIIEQTPLRVLGINWNFHYRTKSEDAWNTVGDRLVPKQDWQEVLSGRPGMRTLVVEGERPDNLEGYIRVRVEPSAKAAFGIYVEVNDHYALFSASKSPASAREAITIISEQWDLSTQRGLQIAEKIASLGEYK
jgi:hypothetical protein